MIFVKLTRVGYLAQLLMSALPDASWGEVEEAIRRIMEIGETRTPVERDAMVIANLTEFEEPTFPVHS